MSVEVEVEVDVAVELAGGVATLVSLLASCPEAMVAAVGSEGRLVPVPSSLPVGDHTRFERGSGIDLVVPEDQIVILEGWRQAQVEPVVRVDVRLLAQPDRVAALHFVDVRAESGVHAVVIETDDPAAMLASVEASDARRRSVGHVRRDATAVFLEVDAATTTLVGWAAADLVGHSTVEFVHPDDVDRAVESWMAMRSGSRGRTKLRFRHAAGRYMWLEVSNENHLDDPELGCVLSELVDISEEMAELAALQQRERLLARLAEALPIGICHLRSDRQVVYSNAPMVELLGSIDDIDGLIGRVAETDRQRVSLAIEGALDGRAAALEVGVTRGREERRCDLTLRAMRGDRGGIDGVIVCAADVTDRSRLRSELEHRASHDALSGCLNRAATVTALERALRDSQQVAVAYIDIDHFKGINDDLGHGAGDEVLRVVAARLRSVTRVEDTLGRMGGDEFVVICPSNRGAVDAPALVERLREAVSGEVTIAQRRIPLQASVGAAASVDSDRDADALLSRADAAMYKAKRRAHRDATGLTALPRRATP